MAVVFYNFSKIFLSKTSLLPSTAVIPKCPIRCLASFGTLKLSKQQNNTFPCLTFRRYITLNSSFLCNKCFKNIDTLRPILIDQTIKRNMSATDGSSNAEPQLSNKDKLKRAVKEYGATVIIFHVTISLLSLGVAYLAVTSGIDMPALLAKVGLETNKTQTVESGSSMLGTTGDVAAGVSTFVVAYAVHKVFAPVRISITLLCTPLIVRHLRKIGILKPPKPSST